MREKGDDARIIALVHSARVLMVVLALPFLVLSLGFAAILLTIAALLAAGVTTYHPMARSRCCWPTCPVDWRR